MLHPNGVHHLAISTADIKKQIEFMTDVLGMRLVALYWMHGVEGAWHAFLELDEHSYVAFVQMPAIEKLERQLGVTHAGSGGGASAGGTMQHVAFNVDTPTELLALRDRIRSRGLTVVGPIQHGLCDSIYFAGPEDLSLEIATSERAIDGRAWIDPEVVALAGISPAELERFRAPAPYADRGGQVAQPPLDKSRPWMRGFPPGVYEHLVTVPDDEFTARTSQTEPPVRS
ncbi:MAG TPA: VOC family protein [Myxococcota bacterium]|nr:VOC family protein [Myxococcota bacterium]